MLRVVLDFSEHLEEGEDVRVEEVAPGGGEVVEEVADEGLGDGLVGLEEGGEGVGYYLGGGQNIGLERLLGLGLLGLLISDGPWSDRRDTEGKRMIQIRCK